MLIKEFNKNLSVLDKSQLIKKQTAKVGFNFSNVLGVFNKLEEELCELEEELIQNEKNTINIISEIGDSFFVVCNLANEFSLNCNTCLKSFMENNYNLTFEKQDVLRSEVIFKIPFEKTEKIHSLKIIKILYNNIKTFQKQFEINHEVKQLFIIETLLNLIKISVIENVNPYVALEGTNNKFVNRFNYMAKRLKEDFCISVDQADKNLRRQIWQESKTYWK